MLTTEPVESAGPEPLSASPVNSSTLASRLARDSQDAAELASIAEDLARLAEALGTGEGSLPMARDGRDLSTLRVLADFLDGEDLRRQKRPWEAIRHFRRALVQDPQHVASWHRLGNTLKEIQSYRMSVAVYARALLLDRDNSELLRQLGNALKDAGLYSEANAIYCSLIRQCPNDALSHYSLATLELAEWRANRAKASAKKALAVQPDFTPALLLLADMHRQECWMNEAQRFLAHALRVAPWHKSAHTLQGMILRDVGRKDAAIMALRAEASLSPGEEENWRELGIALADMGRVREAAEVYQRALVIKPDFLDGKAALGLMLLTQGGDRGADAFLETLGIEPNLHVRPRTIANNTIDKPVPLPVNQRVVIATSLMPKRIPVQQAAIRSWRALGFEVVSVNGTGELDALRALFPDVRFVAARRTAETICGRPLVPLEEILHALDLSGASVCGIVNSDIVLQANRDAVIDLQTETRDTLLFGNRVNVADLDVPNGFLYRDGYDYFLFGRDMLGTFGGSEMVVGAPWWDYWMPMAAIIAGVKIHIPKGITALHQIHDIGYSKALHRHFARVFIDDTGHLSRLFGLTPGHGFRRSAVRVVQNLSAAKDAGAWDLSMDANVDAMGRFAVQTIRAAAWEGRPA